jgi:predicted aconitase with swiveling domain
MAVKAAPILPGAAQGPVLRLDLPLSFWGGVDPAAGKLLAPPLESIAGTVLMLPETIGSSSSSAVLLELLRNGRAPAALLLGRPDAILGLGILVAAEMGWPTIPLLLLPAAAQRHFANGERIRIAADGTISLAESL